MIISIIQKERQKMIKLFLTASIILQLILFGTVISSLITFSSNNEWYVNTIYAGHLLFSIILFVVFTIKIKSDDKSYKIPIFLSLFTVISTLPHAIVQDKEMISEGYGEVEYDNRGAYLDGEPAIWTHSLEFDPTNVMFIVSIILSFVLIFLWHKHKDEFEWLPNNF